MKRIVILTGAGISAESGIKTFRDADGLWEGHDVMEVASPSGFQKNPELVFQFYNQRRAQLKEVDPNSAHFALAELENDFDVHIITQNVDNLHERAGSSNIVHLHGELNKVRPVHSMFPILDWNGNLNLGDLDEHGNQLRPHIVWFGEDVPNISIAAEITQTADIFVVIGTSMQVYPAASLIDYVPKGKPVYIIDPSSISVSSNLYETHIQKTATEGIKDLLQILKKIDV